MGEKQEELRDELVPDTAPGEEEDFALDSFDMLRVIGTGTFARVCLCQVSYPFPSFFKIRKYIHCHSVSSLFRTKEQSVTMQ